MLRFSAVAITAFSLFMHSAFAHDAPTPELGCNIFDSKGRIIQPDRMSDKELMQAMNCKRVEEAQNAAAQERTEQYQEWKKQYEAAGAAMQDALDQQKASTQQIRDMQPAGGGAQIPYPAPGNAPTVIIQSQ